MRFRAVLAGLAALLAAVSLASTPAVGAGTPAASANPLAGRTFYVDPHVTHAPERVVAPAAAATTDTDTFLAGVAQALWLTDTDTPTSTVAATVKGYAMAAYAAGQLPVLVTYALPDRDCGGASSGGFATSAQYQAWIDQIALGVAHRPAVVIVEPDALAKIPVVAGGVSYGDCSMTAGQIRQRYANLSYAVAKLSALRRTHVYADAGHSHWWWGNPTADYDAFRVKEMAARLRRIGVGTAGSRARGFSLDVSNFYATGDEATFGERVSARLGGAGYVVDTSRNGNGPDASQSWCNPAGRALGALPTATTGYAHADAYLWVKHPGESDGACHAGDPVSGRWFQAYADDLYANSVYTN